MSNTAASSKKTAKFDDIKNITVMDFLNAVDGKALFDTNDLKEKTISKITYCDYRTPSSVYFFIDPGQTNIGYEHIEQIRENSLFAVSKEPVEGLKCFIVPNVNIAFQQFAAAYRRSLNVKICAVTGSVGKTTTMRMIASVLSQHFKTDSTGTKGNIPLAVAENIMRISEDTEFYSLETASSQPGQIHRSSLIGQPDACVITNIGTAHIDLLGSQQNICDTKMQILDDAAPDAPIFLNADDPFLAKAKTSHPIIYYGINNNADYTARKIQVDNNIISFEIVYKERYCPVSLNIHGRHNVYNALASFAVGKWAGMTDEEIAEGLAAFRTDSIRQNVYDAGGVTVIADYFSIDTASMISSFEALAERKIKGKKIAVLGHIMRMGDKSREMHRMVGEAFVKNGLDYALCFDDDTKWIAERIRELGGKTVYFANNKYKLMKWLEKNVRKGDAVLFKGAQKYSHFEDIIEVLYSFPKPPTVHAETAVCADIGSGKITFEKNSKKRINPLSLTMIMTAVLAAEKCSSGEIISIGSSMLRYSGGGYANIHLREGEKISAEDMIFAVMAASAYDAAYALAVHIGGSEKNFVGLMNEKANELGMTDTHFTNSCGIVNDNHYSTAEDMLKLVIYAMSLPAVARTAGTIEYECSSCERKFTNVNRIINPASPYYYPYASGMKTSNNAIGKYCIAVTAVKNGRRAAAVLFASPDEPRKAGYDQNTPNKMFSYTDAMKLLEYTFRRAGGQSVPPDSSKKKPSDPADMPPPSGFRIKGGDCSAAAQWLPVENAEGYVLSYYLASEPEKCIKTRYSQKCRKTILGFKNAVEYLADVYAYRTENGREIKGERSQKLLFVPISEKLKTQSTICLEKGQSAVIKAEYKNTVPEVTFSSSAADIAEVFRDGTVTAHTEGRAEITAEMKNGEKSVTNIVCGRDLFRKKNSEAVIMLTGDLMCAVNCQRRAAKYSFDFSRTFDNIRSLLTSADLAVGVLETVCCDFSPFECEDLRTPSGSPNCNSPSTFLSALEYGGFGAVVTANNHNCDGGARGLYKTASLIEQSGMKNIGTLGENPVFFEVGGIKIAVIALCMIMNGLEGASGLDTENLGRYDPELFERLCQKAKDGGAEFIIAYQHWGKMNSSAVRNIQKRTAQHMADCGADIIVGSHPHVMQKFSYLTAADGRKVPCAYSLGNFLTSMSEFDENRLSAIMCLKLFRSEKGISSSVTFIPTVSVDTEYGISVESADGDQENAIRKILTSSAPVSKTPCRTRVMLQGSVVLKRIFDNIPECPVSDSALIISPISLFSGNKADINEKDCPIRVKIDTQKSFEEYLSSCGAEYAAVDFYPAAGISLLKRNGSLYTNSDAFRSSEFYKENAADFEKISPPFEPSLWREAVRKYAAALKKVFPKERIILLRLEFSSLAVKGGEVRNGSDRTALNRRIREMEEYFIQLADPCVIDIAGDYFADGENSSPSAFEPLFYADAADKFREIIFGKSERFYFAQSSPEYRMHRIIKYYDNLAARAYMNKMLDSERAADLLIMYSSKEFAAQNSVSLIKLMKTETKGLAAAVSLLKNDLSAQELVQAAYAIDAVLKNDLSRSYDFYSVLFRYKMNILKLMAKQLTELTGHRTETYNTETVFLLKNDPERLTEYCKLSEQGRTTIDIWGSCISRESVNRSKDTITVNKYIFKQMHLLAFDPPSDYIVPSDSGYFCGSGWRRRTIADCFARSGIKDLSDSGSDWLIVDFYDLICEAVLFRGQLLEVDDFVKRTEFYKSICHECKSTYLFDFLGREDCNHRMKRFAEFVRSRYGDNVILVKADLKDSYITLDDRLAKLSDKDGRLADKREFILFCEKLFAELTDCYVIDISGFFYSSDKFPLGGAHIVHYEDDFYSEVCRIITEILGGSQRKYYGDIDEKKLLLRDLRLNRP